MPSILLVRIRKYLGRLPIDHDAGNLDKPLNNFGNFNTKFSYSDKYCLYKVFSISTI